MKHINLNETLFNKYNLTPIDEVKNLVNLQHGDKEESISVLIDYEFTENFYFCIRLSIDTENKQGGLTIKMSPIYGYDFEINNASFFSYKNQNDVKKLASLIKSKYSFSS